MIHIYLTTALFVLDLVLRIYFCVRIILRRLPVGVSWAWLCLILFLPLFGTILYFYLGEYRLGRRRRARLTKADGVVHELARSLPVHADREPGLIVARTARGLFEAPALDGNDIELLRDANEAFPRLIADIDAAKVSCDFEFFIWSDGGRADDVAEALIRASGRGVRCRVLVDQIGSSAFLRGAVVRRLRASGVVVCAALPSGLWRSLFSRPDLRVHRKIVVIDGAIGFTGSLNLADPLLFKLDAGVGHWVDALCRLQGPAVQALGYVFLSDWSVETGEDLRELRRLSPFVDRSVNGNARVQCLPSGPAMHTSPIEETLIVAIYAARSELILTTPYFVPSEALLFALTSAARRGVAVTLIVPARVDSKLTQYASRAFLQDLVLAGVRVALYKPGLLHTKSVTIDREYSIFGSLNLDPRSLRINFEITLAVYDGNFTTELWELQNRYVRESQILDEQTCQSLGWRERLKEDLARLAGPLL